MKRWYTAQIVITAGWGWLWFEGAGILGAVLAIAAKTGRLCEWDFDTLTKHTHCSLLWASISAGWGDALIFVTYIAIFTVAFICIRWLKETSSIIFIAFS